jgi:hypothetical protein
MTKLKKYFYIFIHFNFICGFLYAFVHFVMTPRTTVLQRRLWAYESWIIFSFYCLFVYLMMVDRKVSIKQLKRVILVNLLLLIFPWGLFLLLAPSELLSLIGLSSIYWRILGGMSLAGAVLYYLPYRFYKQKWIFYVLTFGFIDNFLAGMILFVLFIHHQAPFIVLGAIPLLFYFSLVFLQQARYYQKKFK